jgi:hypothetical protein
MAITGADLLAIFKRKSNSAYSQAYSSSNLSAILNEGLIKSLEDIYKNGQEYYTADQTRALITTEATPTVVANKIDLSTLTAFNHFLAVKCIMIDATFRVKLTNISLVDGIYTNITFSRSSALRSTEQVKLTGSVCDGVYYVKQLNQTVYQLYTDEALLLPFYNGIPYNNDGVGQRVVGYYATKYSSDEKIGKLTSPTLYFPKYQLADNFIKLYAGVSNVTSVELDYIRTLPVQIDVTNTTTDLLVTYPQELLYKAADKAAYLFGSETGYTQLMQGEVNEIAMNNKETP